MKSIARFRPMFPVSNGTHPVPLRQEILFMGIVYLSRMRILYGRIFYHQEKKCFKSTIDNYGSDLFTNRSFLYSR